VSKKVVLKNVMNLHEEKSERKESESALIVLSSEAVANKSVCFELIVIDMT
jgi:hypothetical protein